ncbi:MAG: LLM class F420-dependent oxidoreductase [Rhodospirillaceae bacterium]|jgi:probable F420-dependent oxidoreductase|nr:LLM class F420-dependent oxidoreductase [Rhodospirillaceae bacterium]MBT5899098.1 LLM class F420-dependent oxidoreductase [Rhodospirillaceae bacterium]
MDFGISFPQTQIGNDPVVIRNFVETAEELGFERLTLVDHILGAREAKDAPWAVHYTIEYGFHEPMTLFAWIAGFTKTIRLVTANVVLPQRQTELVAKQAAEIDILTGGRLDLGIGVGWSKSEFEALGMNFADRGDRIEEQVELMRRLWTDELVEFDGKWHQISDMGMNPRPIQRPIPVWFGAMAAVAVRRAARIGDGWLMSPRAEPDDEMKRLVETYLETGQAAGRDAASLGIDATVYAEDRGPNEWLSEAQAWRDIGATSVTFRTSESGFTHIDQHLDAMRKLADAVG